MMVQPRPQVPPMCGRYTLYNTAAEIARYFKLAEARDLEPRYNIAPTNQVPVVRADAEGRRTATWTRKPRKTKAEASGDLFSTQEEGGP